MAYVSKKIDPNLGNTKKSLIDKHYYRKHGKDSYCGQYLNSINRFKSYPIKFLLKL